MDERGGVNHKPRPPEPPFNFGSAPTNFQKIWGCTTWPELAATTKFSEPLKKGTEVMASYGPLLELEVEGEQDSSYQ